MGILKHKSTKQTEQEKVKERREEVLATGRKYKYPLQWTTYRVVINTALIATVLFAMLALSGWLALYRLGMTSDLLFNITRFIPLPVASVDSEKVRFSDYLMLYRSSITPMEEKINNQTIEGSIDELKNEYKNFALVDAEKFAYAIKLAKELDITVSQEEIDKEFVRHLNIGGIEHSEEGLMKIIKDNFGLSKSEYERMLYLFLIKTKVEQAIDEKANKITAEVESILSSNGHNFRAVAEKLKDAIIYEETGGLIDSKNIDGGRAAEAMKLEPGKTSNKFISTNGDGYYFVKLIKKTDTKVDFVSIKVPFTEFDKRFDALREENKIDEYITIKNSDEESEDTE